MIFRRFPYTTLNDINLDWIIKQVKQIAAALQGKQDKPDSAGVAGQVLGLDENLDPVWLDQTGGGGGTTNYNNLTNKPQINGVTMSGNKTAADLGLANASDIPAVPVQSVNGQIGAVVLDAADVGALPDSTVIPVQSVNGQTGAVMLDAGDVGALPSTTTIPTASLALPEMDGTASAGSNISRFAMEGHVHPHDTSKQDALTFDARPTNNSTNPVTSTGIYNNTTISKLLYVRVSDNYTSLHLPNSCRVFGIVLDSTATRNGLYAFATTATGAGASVKLSSTGPDIINGQNRVTFDITVGGLGILALFIPNQTSPDDVYEIATT